MKIKYINETKKHKPMTVYKARCMFDIEQVFCDKKAHCCQLKNGQWLVYYSRVKRNEQNQALYRNKAV